MTEWRRTIKGVGPVLAGATDAREWAERRDQIVPILEADPAYGAEGGDFWTAVEELKVAATVEDADEALELLYDYCDEHAIWIDPHE